MWIELNQNTQPPETGKYLCFVPANKHYRRHWDFYKWNGKNFIDTQPKLGDGRIVEVSHYMILQEPTLPPKPTPLEEINNEMHLLINELFSHFKKNGTLPGSLVRDLFIAKNKKEDLLSKNLKSNI